MRGEGKGGEGQELGGAREEEEGMKASRNLVFSYPGRGEGREKVEGERMR